MKFRTIFAILVALFSWSLFAYYRISMEMVGKTLNVYSNHQSISKDENIKRAIIVIHGALRVVNKNLKIFQKLLRENNHSDKVLVLAPKFKIQKEIKSAEEELFWKDAAWKIGGNSIDGTSLSSFSVIDNLIALLADQERYPNLKDIYLLGHSAGGQFVQRYALLSENPMIEKYKMKFFILNPSSYTYLDAYRPVPSTEDEFARPFKKNGMLRSSFSNLAEAPDYNSYKYGLENRVDYSSHLQSKNIRKQYGERAVYYCLGLDDKDPSHQLLDTTPSAMFQGTQRLERGQKYFYRLNQIFKQKHKHTLIEVPDVEHDADGMIRGIRELLLMKL